MSLVVAAAAGRGGAERGRADRRADCPTNAEAERGDEVVNLLPSLVA